MANILLVPVGSSGDVHPFVGLGVALRARGHRVTVITNPYFEGLVRQAELDFVGFGTVEEFESVLLHPDGWHPRRGLRVILEWGVLPFIRMVYDHLAERHIPGETVVAAAGMAFGARVAQEKLGVPLVTVHLQPTMLRSVHDTPLIPAMHMPNWTPAPVKRFCYWLGDVLVIDPILDRATNAVRAELGLPPVRRLLDVWWHSPERILGLYPEWFASPQPDWPAHVTLTGFPLFDERGYSEPPADVLDFLDRGEPPVVFTAGSAMRQGHAFFAAAAETCRLLGRRGLLLTRYPEQLPASLPEGVHPCRYMPFSQLLPRAAALVHHGGIGTTAQAMAAGVPQLIRPLSYDQPDNAARVERLGVGRSLSPRAFTAPAAARRLSELLGSPAVAARCREVARKFHGVDPVGDACRVIEEMLPRPMREPAAPAAV